jgi:hypothetical protein
MSAAVIAHGDTDRVGNAVEIPDNLVDGPFLAWGGQPLLCSFAT